MQLLIIAFYIYILVLFWAVGQTREGKKESVYTGERERERYFYVRGLSSVTPAVTDF